MSTDSGGSKPAISGEVSTDSDRPKRATCAEASTDVAAARARAPGASACEPYRELIEWALEHGRNATAIWQDLVDTHEHTVFLKTIIPSRKATKEYPGEDPNEET